MDLRPFYRRPAFLTFLGALFVAVLYMLFLAASGLRPALPIAVFDLLLALATLLLMTALTAQFVLPVQRWNSEVNRVLGDNAFVKVMGSTAMIATGGSPEDLAAILQEKRKLGAQLAKIANLRYD